MRFTLLALAVVPPTFAFATYNPERRQQDCPFAKHAGVAAEHKRNTAFDPSQLVDVTGRHAFVPPQNGDLRGPCPGLNALANHGYLAHSGLTSLTQAIYATTTVFNMGADIATTLSAISVAFAGNPLDLTWSIGGAPPKNLLTGLLGRPSCLSGSHNKYESDSSPGRGDAYTHNGDASTLDIENFLHLYNLTDPATGNYDIEILKKQRVYSFDKSVNTNPYFFYGPFTGLLVSQAAHTFIPRFMSNNSENGVILSGDVLRSFFGVSEDLKVQRGHERIPENWYRRSTPYTLPGFTLDALDYYLEFPQLLAVGGNTGEVNTFTGVDVAHLTNGVYNIQTLLEGDNLWCFIYQLIQNVTPDIASGILKDITAALNLITTYIAPQFAGLRCPQLEKFDTSVFGIYPGAGDTFETA